MTNNHSAKKVKVGVIGLGKMGLLHASLLGVMPNVELSALCEKSWVLRKLSKAALDVPLVTDKISDLSIAHLDAIYVATPIPSHYGIVKQIFDQKIAKNVFVEKTLALNYPQSQELCHLAQQAAGVNMVGYMKRFSVTFQKAKKFLEENVLGDLCSFEAYAYSSDFVGVAKDSASGARGGVLEDLGSHVVDLAIWLFEEAFSSAKVQSCAVDGRDSVHFDVLGSKSLVGKFDVSWVKPGYRMPEFALRVKGSRGILRVDDNALELTLDGKDAEKWFRQDLDDHVFFLLGESEYYRENELFVRSILEGGSFEPSFLTASKVDCLLEQVRCKVNA